MNLTVDQKIKMLIGEYAVQITSLETQLAKSMAENTQLKAQLDEKVGDSPAQETADTSKQEFGRPVANGGATPV